MGQISKDQVIQDTRDAYVEVTGDTSPVTYGGETGLANKVRTLGKLLDNTITFKVDNEDYYISSCKTSATISEPPIPTITSFLYWATTTSSSVSFPYTPTGSTTLVAVYEGGPTPPTPGVDVTYTTENIEELGGEIIDLGGVNEFVVPKLGLIGGESYNVSFTFADNTTLTTTGEAVDMSEEIEAPTGTLVAIVLGGHAEGIYDGLYFTAEQEQIIDSTKCAIYNLKDMFTDPVSMVSVTIQGPVESEE